MLFGLLNCVGLVGTAFVKVKFDNPLLRAILLIAGANYAGGQITDFIGLNLGCVVARLRITLRQSALQLLLATAA